MRILKFPKPSNKTIVAILLIILLAGTALALYLLRQQQDLRQRASETSVQTAKSVCSADGKSAVIQVSFNNTKSEDVGVIALDLQTKRTLDMDIIDAGTTKTGQILTNKQTLSKGSVLFTIVSVKNGTTIESKSASYDAFAGCASTPPPVCSADQGQCLWDPEENATSYDIKVIDVDTGETVKSETVPATATQSAFTMIPGKKYQCSVTAINACGTSQKSDSEEKTCTVPTPTGPICPTGPEKISVCMWDPLPNAKTYQIVVTDAETGETIKTETVTAPTNSLSFPTQDGKTYQCSVKAVNQCSETDIVKSPPKSCSIPTPTVSVTVTPTVTPTVSPTVTPTVSPSLTPTNTPTNTPTPTPTVPPSPTPTLTPTPTPTRAPTPTRIPTPTRTPTPTPTRFIPPPPQNPPQQPPAAIAQQQPVVNTPQPTLPPTGDVSTTIMFSVGAVLVTILGAAIFFIL